MFYADGARDNCFSGGSSDENFVTATLAADFD